MNGDGTPDGTRVELFARESLPEAGARRRDSVTGRLQRLATEGYVNQLNIHTWENKVPVDGDALENQLYDRFRAWAVDVGVDLEPFFDTRECYSYRTGDRGEQVVLPALCIAVYRDGDLQSVYPHSTNADSRSVMDCLHALESGRRGFTEETERDDPPIEPAE
jgi:hypothetical protein